MADKPIMIMTAKDCRVELVNDPRTLSDQIILYFEGVVDDAGTVGNCAVSFSAAALPHFLTMLEQAESFRVPNRN